MKLKMLGLLLLLYALLGSSCQEEVRIYDADDMEESETYICHHLGSPLHGAECTDECFVPGDATKYCWLKDE